MIVWVKEKDSLKLETLKEDHTFLLYDISVTVFPYKNFCKLSSYTFTFEKSRVRYGQCIAFMDSVHELQGRIIIEKDDMALGNGSLMRAMPCALINRPDLNVA